MPYSDRTYFLKRIKESELDTLTVNDAGTPQESYLTDAIASADNMIDNYLRNVVNTLPLDPAPESIAQCSYYIASYYLHDRIQYNDIPERVKDNYDIAINLLKDIASGKASIEGVDEDDLDSQVDYDVNDILFKRDSF